METKICSKCKQSFPETMDFFHKDKHTKSGFKCYCKNCTNINSKQYYNSNQSKIKKQKSKYRKQNKNKLLSYNKKYRRLNKEKTKIRMSKYRKQNIEKIRLYQKNKYANDIIYRMGKNIRRRIQKYIKGDDYYSNILGCSTHKFKIYLEKQFTEGMSWTNYGYYGWHIDHIIPLSSAKNKKELIKLCHYTNCQPLWAKDNLIKSDRHPRMV